MIFSEKTLGVLKNFSSINGGILFRQGNTLRTVSPQKTIMAKAEIDETMERDFAIFELPRFLGAMSLFENPEVDFGEVAATIKSGKQKLVYAYADAATITVAPAKDISFPVPEVMFNMKSVDFLKVQRAGHVMGLPEIAVTGDGSSIYLKAVDSKNPTSDAFVIEVGETDKTFNAIFKSENLKMIHNDYDVSISSKGIAKFDVSKLTYWVATEATSKFGE